jgi:hypothetical protein
VVSVVGTATALQLRVSFGRHSSLFQGSLVTEQFSFYGMRLLASRPTPNLDDQGIPLRLAPTP